jgi:hypothetical protein
MIGEEIMMTEGMIGSMDLNNSIINNIIFKITHTSTSRCSCTMFITMNAGEDMGINDLFLHHILTTITTCSNIKINALLNYIGKAVVDHHHHPIHLNLINNYYLHHPIKNNLHRYFSRHQ